MRCVLCVAAIVLGVFAATVANASVIGTFVEADATNTDNALSPGSAWGTTTDSAIDNLWQTNQGKASSHASYNVFADHDAMVAYHDKEDAPEIATTISGLTPGGYYAIRLLFGSHTNTHQQIRGGLSAGSLTLYDDTSPIADAGTLLYESGYMNRYQALLGTAVANSEGKITAYVDSATDTSPLPNTTGRTMFDGLSYESVPAPEPSTLALLVVGLLSLMAYAWRRQK